MTKLDLTTLKSLDKAYDEYVTHYNQLFIRAFLEQWYLTLKEV